MGLRRPAQWYSPQVTAPSRSSAGSIDARQPGLPDRHAVEVLVVERAQVGELDERRDRRQARVGRAALEALDDPQARRPSVGRASSSATASVVRRAHASSSSLPRPSRGRNVRTTFVACANGVSSAPGPARSMTDSCSWSGRSSAGKSRHERTTTPSSRFVRPWPAGPSVGNAARPSGRTRGSTASSTWVMRTGSPPRTTSTSTPSGAGTSPISSAGNVASSQPIRPPSGSRAAGRSLPPPLRRARPTAGSFGSGSLYAGPETETAATQEPDASKTGAATALSPTSSSSTATAKPALRARASSARRSLRSTIVRVVSFEQPARRAALHRTPAAPCRWRSRARVPRGPSSR